MPHLLGIFKLSDIFKLTLENLQVGQEDDVKLSSQLTFGRPLLL